MEYQVHLLTLYFRFVLVLSSTFPWSRKERRRRRLCSINVLGKKVGRQNIQDKKVQHHHTIIT